MYGQTGSGKTHTVIGNPNDEGIFILTGKKLLNYADELYLSAYQIYNDTLYDLLNKNKKLKLLEDRNNTFQIPNMEIIKINNINDLNNMVLQLKNNRNRFFQIKFDECIIFQKLSEQEKVILSVLDHLQK